MSRTRAILCVAIVLLVVTVLSVPGWSEDQPQWGENFVSQSVQTPNRAEITPPGVYTGLRQLNADYFPVKMTTYYDQAGDNTNNDSKSVKVDIESVSIGTNGGTTRVRIQESPDSQVKLTRGYVAINLDRLTETGNKISSLSGKKTQRDGWEYYATLWTIGYGYVEIIDSQYKYVTSVDAKITGTTIEFDLPLDRMEDDGNLEVAFVLGDSYGPTDWAPEEGSYTVLIAESNIYPRDAKGDLQFLGGESWNLVFTTAEGKDDIKVYDRFVFLDALYELKTEERSSNIAGRRSFRIKDFGMTLSTGDHEVAVITMTNRGMFVSTSRFKVIQP